ncbi:Pre-mRNA-splicing factor cwf20 [Vanrija pseudolonga]|uniref:Pre-mRNA-splicing factor cwf20 n=1 Tax=Vanrija pseudolonga TaxID=143232 RepID=A0AAF0YEN3_9TREE|nr:Pre-mRNA-splicing factor cwf20 [Vanrija pseudolonga]
MLLANYGSDSDSDNESGPSSPPPAPKAPASAAAKGKRKAPIKITLDLPKPSSSNGDDEPKAKEKAAAPAPPAKKAKIAGAGSSSLLGMLPPPKRKIATTAPSKSSLAVNKSMAAKPAPVAAPARAPLPADDDSDDEKPALMVPAALKRGANKKDEALDLFGLAEAPAPKPKVAATTPRPPTVSAAPAVADFVPPEPTAHDPYPGYYQLPSGAWAAYDAAYYASFFAPAESSADAAKAEEERALAEGRVGRHWKDLADGRADVVDVNVGSSLDAARRAEELKAKLVKPKLPSDEFEYEAIGQTKGLAADRHQLTSLLHSAYSQRDELEARIQQNKKNMRMASQKYGF